jgi:hypothetical protein
MLAKYEIPGFWPETSRPHTGNVQDIQYLIHRYTTSLFTGERMLLILQEERLKYHIAKLVSRSTNLFYKRKKCFEKEG